MLRPGHTALICFFFLASVVSSAWPRNWTDSRQIGQFSIYADFPLQQQRTVVTELVELQRDVEQTLRLGPAREPVSVFLFASKQAYTDYLNRYFRGAPERRALFIKGSQPGWVFAYVNPKLSDDLRHECTHALLHSRLGAVPLWLDEGLAEYFEIAATDRLNGNPHQGHMRWTVRFRRQQSIARLEELRDVRDMGKTEYQNAWAWVHFMLHGPDAARQQLHEYLDDIENGIPPGRLSDRLLSSLPNLDDSFRRHFLQ